MREPTVPRRRRLWPVFVPAVSVAGLAILWTGLWFYAASTAETALAGWRQREARVGRIYDCGHQTVGGYPFRIEVRCADPRVELRREVPPVSLAATDLLVVAQVYQPTLLIAQFAGPMRIAEPGHPTSFIANWTVGQASVRGTPSAPERASIVVDGPSVDQVSGDGGRDRTTVFKAAHLEVHARPAQSSTTERPVIDLALRLAGASAPDLHPIAAQPFDADIAAAVHGLPDLAPKPWPVRLRDLQARGGKIEIAKARVQQVDIIAVAAGTLGLTEAGGLDGQLQVTIVGLDKVLKALDVDRLVSEGNLGAKFDSLDRIVPGLGRAARKNATPGILAGLGAMGQSTTLEGKPAISLPLRFANGQVFLGPIAVGRIAPLF